MLRVDKVLIAAKVRAHLDYLGENYERAIDKAIVSRPEVIGAFLTEYYQQQKGFFSRLADLVASFAYKDPGAATDNPEDTRKILMNVFKSTQQEDALKKGELALRLLLGESF